MSCKQKEYKMKKLTIAVALASTVLLQACAGVGNSVMKDQTQSSVNAQIVKGTTTRSDLIQSFGMPYSTSFTDSGNVIYTYSYDDTNALTMETVGSALFTWGLAGYKSKGERTELTVLFDSNDVVKNFTVNKSKIEAGTGLFK